MTFVAYLFPELPAPKDVIRSMSKKLRFRKLFDRQHGKCVETLLQSERQQLYNIY